MGRKAILFIHGFSATFAENEYCINRLQMYKKYDTYIFTLPGHENVIMDNKVKYEDWIDASDKFLRDLLARYHEVILIGHSMGGVIASYLATIYKIKKLILIAPAFEYLNLEQNKKDFLATIKNHSRKDNGFVGLGDKFISVRINNIIEFRKLVNRYHDDIMRVQVPTLILHGNIDNVVPLSSSIFAFNNVATTKKYLTIVKNVRHQMFITSRREEIVNYIYQFIRRKYTFKNIYKDKL